MGESITHAQFRSLLSGSDEAFEGFFFTRPQLLDSLIVSPNFSMTPLAYTTMMVASNEGAISLGSLSKFKYLLSTKKVDVNGRKGRTNDSGSEYNPLCLALYVFATDEDSYGQSKQTILARTLEVMEILLQAGANINVEAWSLLQGGPRGEQTLFMSACDLLFPEAVTLLLKYKARVNEANSIGVTPLMLTLMKADYQYNSANFDPKIMSILNSLLNAGANINAQDQDGETALMYTVITKNPKAFEYLILRGANKDLRNRYGQTAFDLARPELKAQLTPFFKDRTAAKTFEAVENSKAREGQTALPTDVTKLVGSFLGVPPKGGRRTKKGRKHKKKRKYTRKYK
jgi:hypothetical protein